MGLAAHNGARCGATMIALSTFEIAKQPNNDCLYIIVTNELSGATDTFRCDNISMIYITRYLKDTKILGRIEIVENDDETFTYFGGKDTFSCENDLIHMVAHYHVNHSVVYSQNTP